MIKLVLGFAFIGFNLYKTKLNQVLILYNAQQ